MKLVEAPLGKGIDASTYINPDQAAALADDGYKFVVRYVRRDKHVNEKPDCGGWPVSLSTQELHELLDVGLCVGLVQFGRFRGRNYLSVESGYELGEAAAHNAHALGAPEGVTVYCDAEWTDSPAADLVLSFLGEWGRGGSEGNIRPGIYSAFEGLDGSQWYGLPYFQTYWASAMHAALNAPPLPRGYSMYQHTQRTIHGVVADPNYTVADFRDMRPWFISA